MPNWPAEQNRIALKLTTAVISEEHKKVGEPIPELTVEHFKQDR